MRAERLLSAAKKYGIVPIGFMTGQLDRRTSEATAGRLVIELGQVGTPGRVRAAPAQRAARPTLTLLHWSDSAGGYLDGAGQLAALPDTARQAGSDSGTGRAVTLLERQGRPMTALVHDPAVLKNPDLVKTVTAALRLAVENDRLRGQVEAQASEVRTLPGGSVTFLLTDIEGSTGLLQRLGDRYAALLADVRAVIRSCMHRAGGREVDARADEFFAVFVRASAALEAAVEIERGLRSRAWPDGVGVRVRVGIHSGRPTLTDSGYVGLAVHTVARICSAAHGGQILLSGAARDAVGRARPTGLRLRSLGIASPARPARGAGDLSGGRPGPARPISAAAHALPRRMQSAALRPMTRRIRRPAPSPGALRLLAARPAPRTSTRSHEAIVSGRWAMMMRVSFSCWIA